MQSCNLKIFWKWEFESHQIQVQYMHSTLIAVTSIRTEFHQIYVFTVRSTAGQEPKIRKPLFSINLLELEFYIKILAHPVGKM